MSLAGLSPYSRKGYGSSLFGVGEDPALGFKARLISPFTDCKSHDPSETPGCARKNENAGQP